jgi:hypothetical protein
VEKKAPAKGRPRKWGQRLPAPRDHEQWEATWQNGQAWIYGHKRAFRYQQMTCFWAVTGPAVEVQVFVFAVAGYEREWYLVTSALELTAAQVVEAFAGRFRQEDCFRDHQQQMGMEECRAWTKEAGAADIRGADDRAEVAAAAAKTVGREVGRGKLVGETGRVSPESAGFDLGPAAAVVASSRCFFAIHLGAGRT